jgi:exosortase
MGLNVVLGVFAYRDLLTFQPRMYSVASGLEADAEQYLFTPNETAPLIVVLMSLWLVYHRRATLFALPQRGGPGWLAAVAVAIGLPIYFWAIYTSAPDLQGISLICTLVAALTLWRGFPAVRICFVPLFLLLYAIPLPSPVIAKMIWNFQLASAQLSGWMLYWIGIPHVVSSEMIYLPQDTYQVIESCSGFRSIQTLSMFAILMSDLFDRSRRHMLFMVAASVPVAFFMNGLRVTTLILNPASQIHTIHVGQGLVVLMGGLVVLYTIDGLLGRALNERPREWAMPSPEREAAASGASLLASPMVRAGTVTTLLGVMLLGLYAFPVWQHPGSQRLSIDELLARATRGWISTEMPEATNDLAKVSFRESHRRQYSLASAAASSGVGAALRGPEPPVEVFVGVGEHLDRFKSPFSPKTALPGRGWVVEDAGTYDADGLIESITWRQLRSGTQRVLAYHWYEQDRGLLEESIRSFFALDRSDFARDLPVVAVRLSTPIEEAAESDVRQAHARLKRLHELVAGALQAMEQAQDRTARTPGAARSPDFPLWETFFTLPCRERAGNYCDFRGLNA